MTERTDTYYSNLMKIVFGVYAENKEVARQLIENSNTVPNICGIVYRLLVSDKVIDPCESTDKKTIAKYLIEII